ncbi:restriction endonuclease [Actinomadura sp. 7K534]|uniref:restriction endonuclease n=1 Tax=Actinomadura sp. 7K534 TaxID=2530366 RepID=UPI00104B248A|nr:restriction endonuclease [Actinomadura sp. 7K534]TDB90729.1 hypothetical protein E1266_27730 [Actinomadura sp. 7K534]
MWESLLADYQRLAAIASAHQRGRRFEELLERLFQQAHFCVDRDPSAAAPRQTDLVARYGDTWYLIEAKWQNAPVDVSVLDAVRSRMDRTASRTAIGVIISVSGFTESAVEDLRRYRNRAPILLFGEEEIAQILKAPRDLLALLRSKHERLVAHGEVQLATDRKSQPRPRPSRDLPECTTRLLDTGLTPVDLLTSDGQFGEFVFVPQVPDVDWEYPGGHGVSLDLPLRAFNQEHVVDLVHTLSRLGLRGSEPRWIIQQSTVNWHGVGARTLCDALRAWEARTADLIDAHHTEQVVYFDTCPGGGFYTITADVAMHTDRQVYRCNVSFQLPGVPLDTGPLRHLFERYQAGVFHYFRPMTTSALTRFSWPRSEAPILEVVGYVVVHDDLPPGFWSDVQTDETQEPAGPGEVPTEWVTGVVARNPYRAETGITVPPEWPKEIQASDRLICSLRNHHPLDRPSGAYRLESWRYARTSDALVFQPLADW